MPALLLWVVLIATPAAITAHQTSSIPFSATGAITYTNDFLKAWTNHVAAAFDQSWSLGVEEQFYLLWPAVLIFGICRTRRTIQNLLFAALTALAVAFLLHGNYFLPTGHLVPLTLGAWAAWAMTGRLIPHHSLIHFATPVSLVCSITLIASLLVPPLAGTREFVLTCIIAVAAVGLIVAVDGHRDEPVARLFGSSLPCWVGARSYGIYLYGLTVIQLVGSVTHLRLRDAAGLDIVITLAIAAVSYRYIESPIRAAGRRWLQTRSRAANTDASMQDSPSHNGAASTKN